MGDCIVERQPFSEADLPGRNLVGELKVGVTISNLKLKGLQSQRAKEGVSLFFQCGQHQFATVCKKDLTCRWTDSFSFALKLPENKLRESLLLVKAKNEKGAGLTRLQLKLFSILHGPFHLDYQLSLGSKQKCRLSFDCRMSQELAVEVFATEVVVNMEKHTAELSYSYHFRVFSERNAYQSQSSRLMAFKDAVHSKEGVEIKFRDKGPLFKFEAGSSDLDYVILHLVVSGQHDENQGELDLCEAHISCSRLFNAPAETEDEYCEHRTLEGVQLPLFSHGLKYGSVSFNIHTKNSRFYKQPTLGVRSEQGVLNSSPIFTKPSQSKDTPEVAEITKALGKLQAELTGILKAPSKFAYLADVQANFETLKRLLSKSYKQSSVTYLYEDRRQLMAAQEVLLELGFGVHKFEQIDSQALVKRECQSLLVLLIRRGELSLHQMRMEGQPSPEQKRVSIRFQKFVYEMLAEVLSKLQKKDLFSEEKKFIEVFLVYCYFLVPRFRAQFLQAVDRADDPLVSEWRGTEYELTQNPRDFTEFGYKEVFDWENNFYKYIRDEQKSQAKEELLREMLKPTEWKRRIAKRGTAFFCFLQEWMEMVRHLLVSSQTALRWQDLPGYKVLLRGMLCEFKIREVGRISQAMRGAAEVMLQNERILNSLVLIIFQKTNLHDSGALFKTLELVSRFLRATEAGGKRLPASFNFDYFITGLKIAIESSNCYAAAMSLKMLYDFFDLLQLRWQLNMMAYFLGAIFNTLFSHWSRYVRHCFHHLLMYCLFHRIYHFKDSSRPQDAKLVLLMRKAYESRLVELQEELNEPRPLFLHEMEQCYHKRMKLKLRTRHQDRRRELDSAEKHAFLNARKNINGKGKSSIELCKLQPSTGLSLTRERSEGHFVQSRAKDDYFRLALSKAESDEVVEQDEHGHRLYMEAAFVEYEKLNMEYEKCVQEGRFRKPPLNIEVKREMEVDESLIIEQY